MKNESSPRWRTTRRVLFLAPAAVALLAGLDAALLLLGVWAPVDDRALPGVHGGLMVLGFVGTVISLERAVASTRAWAFLSPLFLGLGAILLLSPLPIVFGSSFLLAGCLILMTIYIPLHRRNGDPAILVQGVGAGLASAGVLMWMGGVDFSNLIPWFAGFMILTIGAERLELARVAISKKAEGGFLLLMTAIVIGIVATLMFPLVGAPILGLAILGFVVWLAVNDVARRTIRAKGAARYMAACLLAGYVWLAVAGLIWTLAGTVESRFGYDALVHSIFLGFTISMIMAHASVILPAVLRVKLPYHRGFLLPAGLLQLGLIVRLGLGDAFGLTWAWQTGGVITVLSLLTFGITAAATAIIATRRASTHAHPGQKASARP